MYEILFILIILWVLLLARIFHRVFRNPGHKSARPGFWLNLFFILLYSGFCWIPIVTYEDPHCDLCLPDFGVVILILVWIIVFTSHLVCYALILELMRIKTKKVAAAQRFYKHMTND
jgi:hypothetical protein